MIEIMRRTQFDPARLHGHIKLELFDAESKQLLQKTEKDNLVTNALKYMLNNVAGGTPGNLSNMLMPIATRALGGLMLFSNTLDADVTNIHFPFAPNSGGNYAYLVGSAGRGTNTDNTMSGSLNQAESGPTDSGYVSVWDFGTSQANGTIKAAALTQNSAYAGTTPFRSGVNAYDCHDLRRLDGSLYYNQFPLFYDTTTSTMYYGSIDSSMGYSRTWSSGTGYTYTLPIYSMYIPLQKYKVGDAIDAYKFPTFICSVSWTDSAAYDPIFLPGYDGYAYLTIPSGNSSGNGSFRYLSLKTNDASFTLSDMTTVSLTETYLRSGTNNVLVTDDYFWALANNQQGLYRINRSNTASVELFAFQENYYAYDSGRLCPGDGINIMLYCPAANGQSGYYDQYDAMIYPDGTVVKNGNYFLRSNSIYQGGSTHYVQAGYESPYLWVWGGKSGYSGNTYGCYGVASPRYLGTIANLSSAVVKNASQTLKVTYTLTDA